VDGDSAIILVIIAWPATRLVVAQKDTAAADLTIKVTGIQWKWAYDYIDGEGEGISFISTLTTPREQIEGRQAKGEHYLLEVDNELVVPVNRKIRIITTAADVIHAWWVPAFGVSRTRFPASCATPGFAPRRPECSAPVRRAVRQGARLHAGSWCAWFRRRTTASGSATGNRRWSRRPMTRTRS